MKLPMANSRLPIACGAVAQTFLSAGSGDPQADVRLPVVSPKRQEHGTGKSREPAGWKACATQRGLSTRAFTLLEVMIAIAIFFVASFAILSLVGSSLDNVRRLQRPSVDASPVLARYAATNSLVEGAYRGSLGDPDLLGKDYRDYNYAVDIEEIRSNHLYRVKCVITAPANGKRQVISDMSTVLYKPQSPPGSLDGGIGLTGH